MASSAESTPLHLQDPTPAQQALDELLEEIFLRLPTAADLARTAMACVSFRRVIAGHAFLRRFRALHPPPLLGIVHRPFLPAESPHPSAAAARAFADANIDFSCSFLPSPERWSICDLSGGRTLFYGVPEGSTYPRGGYLPSFFFRDFAVCDPLHRRYLLLPVIPDDLAVLVYQLDIQDFDHFLAPPSDDGEDASFRVMCLARSTTKLVLFVFSLCAGQWHAVTFDGWITLMTGPGSPASASELYWASRRHYAHRCFCWAVHPNKLLMLDTRRMEFSAVNLPPVLIMPQRAFVEAGEGKLGMFTLYIEFDGERNVFICFLWYAVLQNDGGRANPWKSVAIIPLPSTYRYNIVGVAGGYLLLQGIPDDDDLYSIPLPERPKFDCFSLNLQTFQLELFCGSKHMIRQAYLYTGFPPSLSAPTI